MAAQNGEVSLIGALVKVGLYKRTQGRLVRQLTALCIAVVFLLGAYAFSTSVMRNVADSVAPLDSKEMDSSAISNIRAALRLGVPTLLGLLGCWVAYRAVNYPHFADFLISVEAEMDKVSWPSIGELKRGTVVVIGVMFSLGAILWMYNGMWLWFFRLINVLEAG